MSQAENLLNTLNTTASLANTSEEPHIVIGDDRVITVPDQLKRLAVQYDHDIETVTFDCPRYWDEHDMSQMSVYINYLRSDTYRATYKADNVTVDATDDSIMHFDWTISRNVSLVTGKIVFLVCVRKTDDNGNEVNHWNSELCKDCYVSEGLEPDAEELKEAYPDIIEQWHDELINRADAGDFNGVTFTPSISDDGVLSWTNNGGLENPKSLKINSVTFTPSVSEDGVLSWTNDGGKANPASLTIHNGVSPTIEVSDIQGGHRVAVKSWSGTYESGSLVPQTFDVKDASIDTSETVTTMLNNLIYLGETEPTSTPVLWLDTNLVYPPLPPA